MIISYPDTDIVSIHAKMWIWIKVHGKLGAGIYESHAHRLCRSQLLNVNDGPFSDQINLFFLVSSSISSRVVEVRRRAAESLGEYTFEHFWRFGSARMFQ